MDPERWRRIKEIFPAALELAPELRAAWLASAVPDDPSLVAEVEGLLAAHDGAGELYDQGALAAVPSLREQLVGAVEGTRIGPYRIVSEIGRGGMGAVYLAVQEEPDFTRKVAIKLVKRGMDTEEVVRRFVAERQILASLAHPNIARLFEGGSTADGRPYFVMEYVEGKPITAYAEDQGLSIEARLALFLRVCGAVQHAHQSLVVHRDLKPPNILVDARGEPKLLDFGIAKLLDPDASLTAVSPSPMTPEYASPEQQSGGPVTTATDVYGLGLLLYELLVGQSPRSVERKLGEKWRERPASQVLRALAGAGSPELLPLARRLAGDLDAILAKALERDPARRFGTVNALVEDLERHLTRRPVSARRSTPAYRLGRLVARHKVASVLAFALLFFAFFSSFTAAALLSQRDQVERQSQRAEALNGWMLRLIQKTRPGESRGDEITVRQVLDAGAGDLLGTDRRYQPETWATLLEAMGNSYRELGLYEQAEKNLQKALELRQSLQDSSQEGALALAGNLTSLGGVAYHREDYEAGRRYYRRSLDIKENLLGPGDLSMAEDWNGLGLISRENGQTLEAGRELARALEISRGAGGDGHQDLVDSYNNLGVLAMREGRYRRAQILLSAAFRYLYATLGEGHPEVTQIQNHLAQISYHLGDFAGSEARFQEIVAIERRVLGLEHPDLAHALLQLGTIQRRRGRLPEARATLDELLRIPRAPGKVAAEAWNLLGVVSLDGMDLAGADHALAKGYERYRSLPGDYRSNLSKVLTSQAVLRHHRGDLAGAVALARRSLDLARASRGPGHPDLAGPLELLADLLRQAGDTQGVQTTERQLRALRADSPTARQTSPG